MRLFKLNTQLGEGLFFVRRVLPVFLFLFVLSMLVVCPAFSAQKFVRAHRDSNFDMYIDVGNMLHNRGVYSFWVKSVYSDSGRALIRKELPSRLRKAAIAYSMDYVVYDSNKGRYKMQICSVWNDKDAEIYREGNKNTRLLKPGSLAEYLSLFAVDAFNNNQ